MTREKVFLSMQILASILITTSFLLESVYNPGKLDTLNALSWATCIFVVWSLKERTK